MPSTLTMPMDDHQTCAATWTRTEEVFPYRFRPNYSAHYIRDQRENLEAEKLKRISPKLMGRAARRG